MIKEIIRTHLVPEEEYIFGFADLRGLLSPVFKGFGYGISIGKKLDGRIVGELTNGPTLEYFNHYREVNKQLARLTEDIHKDLKIAGINALPVEPTIIAGSEKYEKYLKTLSYDISHKMVATRAGLGWIGKTDLLVSRAFGPALRLVTILLERDPGCNVKPVEKSRCGGCDQCVKKCPANAATGQNWNINIHRDSFFDAFRCREMCGELAKKQLNVDERICGMCVNACPIGK